MKQCLLDIHCHTADHSYDGKVEAKVIVKELIKKGYSGVVFTDHNYCWKKHELEELAKDSDAPEGFILLSGQEVRTAFNGITYGDLLVYGIEDSIPDGTSPQEIFKALHPFNGFCIAPHPAVPHIGFGKHINSFPVTGIEVWNGRHGLKANKQALELAYESTLPACGGSDTHQFEDIGGGGTYFENLPNSLDEIKTAFKNDEVQPYKGNQAKSAINWIKDLWKD